MLLKILITFIPWCAYYILRMYFSLPVTSLVVFIGFAIFFWRDLVVYRYVLSIANFLIFGLVLLNSLYLHFDFFQNNMPSSVQFIFALIGIFSLIIKKPFTLQYARQMVSKDKWNNPIFFRVNLILTLCWSIIFSLNASIIFLPVAERYSLFYGFIPYLAVIFGIIFTKLFPAWFKKRQSMYRRDALSVSGRNQERGKVTKNFWFYEDLSG
jgi:hypothetical protein